MSLNPSADGDTSAQSEDSQIGTAIYHNNMVVKIPNRGDDAVGESEAVLGKGEKGVSPKLRRRSRVGLNPKN